MCGFLYCSVTLELEAVLVAPGVVGILTVSVQGVGLGKNISKNTSQNHTLERWIVT